LKFTASSCRDGGIAKSPERGFLLISNLKSKISKMKIKSQIFD